MKEPNADIEKTLSLPEVLALLRMGLDSKTQNTRELRDEETGHAQDEDKEVFGVNADRERQRFNKDTP